MKKLLFIGLAAFFMTNCARESVVDSDLTKSGNKIDFTSYSNITRGNPADDNDEFQLNGNFGVTAFINTLSTAPYMGAANAGAQITYGTSKWNYNDPNDVRFWPTDGEKLSFYAYAPFANTNRVAAPAFSKDGGMIFTNYEVPATAASQEDFMYAIALDVEKATPAIAVPLMFHHAMTQILFKARVRTDANLYVDIAENGITLNNIDSKGTFMLAADGIPSWTTGTLEPRTYAVPSAPVTVHGTTGTDADLKDVFKSTDVLMLLPQQFAKWDKVAETNPALQTNGYLSLSCKLYYKDAAGNVQYLLGTASDFGTIHVPFSSQDSDGKEIWGMRNKITYTLLIDGTLAGLEPIEFTTDVEPWLDANGGNIPL